MDLEDIDNAFAFPDLWKSSLFAREGSPTGSSLFPALQLDITNVKIDNPYASNKEFGCNLQLPALDAFEFGPLEDVEPLDESVFSSDTDHYASVQAEDENIWKIALDLGPADKDLNYYTWESFSNRDHKEPCSAYISEAGSQAFDAALQLQARGTDLSKLAEPIIRSDILLNSLINLGLGRSSVLFTYDEREKTFVQEIEHSRMSGCTKEPVQSLVSTFLRSGTIVKNLIETAEKTYASQWAQPAEVALASATLTTLSTIEDHLAARTSSIRSSLQLQRVFERSQQILSTVNDFAQSISVASTDAEMASIVYYKAQHLESGCSWLRAVVLNVLARVSQPWLDIVGQWTGLHYQQTYASTRGDVDVPFTAVEQKAASETQSSHEDCTYKPHVMPAFIAEEDGRMIFEIGKSLRLIRSHHPDHPLSISKGLTTTAPRLEWHFDWQDMEAVATKAEEYENSLLAALAEYSNHALVSEAEPSSLGPSPTVEPASSDHLEDEGHHYSLEPPAVFDKQPSSLYEFPDELRQLVLSSLHNNQVGDEASPTFSPPLSLAPILSFNPLLTTQARLVNAASLRMLLRSHHLRLHLDLQRDYHLLGDGVFLARLTSALFSPDLETAERRRGIVRTGLLMGLRLGSRKTWPPASSELTLVLMGLLNESYFASQQYPSISDYGHATKRGKRPSSELPGQLSFKIRTLTDVDAEKCMDPNSLHALDFLRLQYKAPSPLHAVITPASLEKYDTIFKFLLRIIRMLFVVSRLPRSHSDPKARKFTLEAHHFVSTCAAYFFGTGVRETWDSFSNHLDDIEHRLSHEDASGKLGSRVKEGIESLRMAHETCLDRILFALLLRKKQSQVMALLTEIFELILEFVKDANEDPGGRTNGMGELHARFATKVRVFLTVCRGLIGKKGYGKGRVSSWGETGKVVGGNENTIERLLLGLEMSGYYTSTHESP